jgi:hypothetical protein
MAMDKDMDISMDIHEKSVDMDAEYHIHDSPENYAYHYVLRNRLIKPVKYRKQGLFEKHKVRRNHNISCSHDA